MQQRQGDLLFVSCDEIPAGVKKSQTGILAHGEVTGHCHKVDLSECDVFVDTEGNMFLEPIEDCLVTHDTHNELQLEKGSKAKMIRQREYDPIFEERQVRD